MTLTKRSNDEMNCINYSTLPTLSNDMDILTVRTRKNGGVCFTLAFTLNKERIIWSAELNNEQRLRLIQQLTEYNPILWEENK